MCSNSFPELSRSMEIPEKGEANQSSRSLNSGAYTEKGLPTQNRDDTLCLGKEAQSQCTPRTEQSSQDTVEHRENCVERSSEISRGPLSAFP